MKPRKRPPSARILNQWVDSYAREHGHTPARVRNWVSHMVLGGALERAGFDGMGRRFTIKGGVALEMRLRHLARATKDLDLILLSDDGDPGEELEQALARPYQGFTFRVRNAPEVMPNGAIRLEVALQYLGKAWGTVQIDASRYEGDGTEIEMVDAISLAPFGIDGPDALPCLSLPYHVAQKIHAMTLPPREGWVNQRYRDLVDLLLLREWITDFETVKRACREVFEVRGTHRWPPFLEVHEHWAEQFSRMAADVGLAPSDLHHAVIDARRFIAMIDSSAEWVAELPTLAGLSATTWYFAIGSDGALHRIPARIGEACFTGGLDDSDIPTEWQREPGGLALIGVVLYLRDRKPVYVEGVAATGVALNKELVGQAVEFGDDVWDALASELLRQTHSPIRAEPHFSIFLSKMSCNLPCFVGFLGDVSTAQAHRWRTERAAWFLWDLMNSEPVKGRREKPTHRLDHAA